MNAISRFPTKVFAGRRNDMKRRQRGITLLEVAMGLAIGAIILAGTMLYFQNASTNSKTNQAISDLANVQQAVRTLYGGQADYTGLDNSIIYDSKAVPQRMKGATADTLYHAFNGAITVAEDTGSAALFDVQFDNLPDEACQRLAVMDLGTGMQSVGVANDGATFVNPAAGTGHPMLPAEANAECKDNANSILWVFH